MCNPFRRALLAAAPGAEVVAAEPAAADTVRLSLGLFPLGDGHHAVALTSVSPAFPGVFDVPSARAINDQVVVDQVNTLRGGLPVLDYRVVSRE